MIAASDAATDDRAMTRRYPRGLALSGSGGTGIEEIGVAEAWRRLTNDPDTVLVDVRTKAEWAFTGLPDLSSLGKQPVLVEWQTFPGNQVDQDFIAHVEQALDRSGASKSSKLLLFCRSGGRSLMAARALSVAGFTHCTNVADGFEGPLDAGGHRGSFAGWKAAGLPWRQG